MMKILCLLNSLGSGGAERQMAYLSSLLAKIGHKVTLCYYAKNNFNASFVDEKVEIVYLTKTSNLGFCISLARHIRVNGYEAIIVFGVIPSIYAAVSFLLSLKYKVKLIISERNYNNGLTFSDYLKRYIPFMVSNYVVCNSLSQKKLLSSRFSLFKSKILYIGNALNCELYHKKMDMSSNPLFFKFILPASFIYSKNHINLAKAILLIKRKYGINNIRISCFGSYIDKIDKNGIKFSSSYLELVNFIQANGIEEFFQINKPIPNLYEFYPHYDALVLPSFYEGCPNAVIEGMASGLPIIASNVSDVSYLIEGTSGGLLFNPLSFEDIASKLMEYIQLPTNVKVMMSEHNRRRALSLFDPSTFLRKYNSLLSDNQQITE